jgi:hypothetical protein
VWEKKEVPPLGSPGAYLKSPPPSPVIVNPESPSREPHLHHLESGPLVDKSP